MLVIASLLVSALLGAKIEKECLLHPSYQAIARSSDVFAEYGQDPAIVGNNLFDPEDNGLFGGAINLKNGMVLGLKGGKINAYFQAADLKSQYGFPKYSDSDIRNKFSPVIKSACDRLKVDLDEIARIGTATTNQFYRKRLTRLDYANLIQMIWRSDSKPLLRITLDSATGKIVDFQCSDTRLISSKAITVDHVWLLKQSRLDRAASLRFLASEKPLFADAPPGGIEWECAKSFEQFVSTRPEAQEAQKRMRKIIAADGVTGDCIILTDHLECRFTTNHIPVEIVLRPDASRSDLADLSGRQFVPAEFSNTFGCDTPLSFDRSTTKDRYSLSFVRLNRGGKAIGEMEFNRTNQGFYAWYYSP